MTTALYRRYRPETFADVIGQEHVTDPLMAAVGAQRASHAYLFSGPRGCGKTTSARILARCLNCANGPAPVPCGTCDSCVELARGGSGSLDVVEIDAASHNGVDDARELRERAAFAPARDRYKIFILDEAHMVTPQGFNALLKLVEEPPPHVKFIFATTEPDKVISTIRSRTHHYPFRLVPPDRLQAYLERICAAEGVTVGAGVLPLVVRAGGGSVRDSLSVLDQLLAGADGELDYAQAVALLGYTPETLLDDVVEALEAADGSSVFRVVDRVIESGHDPRRFVEDLLQRLRDLIVIVAAGERAADVLRGVPEDQFARMSTQAQRLGLAQLSRAGDLTMAALTEMTGATSPRLQLELLCARLLLPAADEPLRGYGARLERLEKQAESGGAGGGAGGAGSPRPDRGSEVGTEARRTRLPARASAAASDRGAGGSVASRSVVGGSVPNEPVVGEAAPADEVAAEGPGARSPAAGPPAPAEAADEQVGAEPAGDEPGAAATAVGEPAGGELGHAETAQADLAQAEPAQAERAPSATRPVEKAAPEPAPAESAPAEPLPEPSAALDTETVRRRWPEVLETLSRIRRASWTITSQNAQVVSVTGQALYLRFDTPGIASAFRNGRHADAAEQALRETLGLALKIEAVTGDGPPGESSGGGQRGPSDVGTSTGDRPDHAARAAADWATEAPRRAQAGEPAARRPGSARGREQGDADQEGSHDGSTRERSRASSSESLAAMQEAASHSSDEPPPAEPPGEYEPVQDDAGPYSAHDGDPFAGDVPTRGAREGRAAALSTSPAEAPRRDWLAEATAAASPERLARAAEAGPTPPVADEWSPTDLDEPDVSDPDLDASPLMGAQLVQRVLGATLIDEIAVDPVGSSARSGP